jgi:hypothetical protein
VGLRAYTSDGVRSFPSPGGGACGVTSCRDSVRAHPRILERYDLPAAERLHQDHGGPRLVVMQAGPDVGLASWVVRRYGEAAPQLGVEEGDRHVGTHEAQVFDPVLDLASVVAGTGPRNTQSSLGRMPHRASRADP